MIGARPVTQGCALATGATPRFETWRDLMATIDKGGVVLLYKRNSQPDEELVGFIETRLAEEGHPVFIDRHLTMGVDWAREIEERIRIGRRDHPPAFPGLNLQRDAGLRARERARSLATA